MRPTLHEQIRAALQHQNSPVYWNEHAINAIMDAIAPALTAAEQGATALREALAEITHTAQHDAGILGEFCRRVLSSSPVPPSPPCRATLDDLRCGLEEGHSGAHKDGNFYFGGPRAQKAGER